jgi:parallel beta-helix repeat protein
VVTTLCTDIGLLIGADSVALNCQGNELTGEPNGDGIVLEDRTGVTVRNCKITGFLDGIQLIRSSGNALITNTIAGAANNGIDFEDDNHGNLVKGNRVVAADNDAINVDVDVAGAATGNTFLTNTLEGAGVSFEDGIDFDGPGGNNTVRGNRISGFFDSGIEVGEESGGNLITENRAEDNCTGILVFSDSNTIERNTTNDNCDGLVVLSDANTVTRNAAEGNFFFGIVVGGDANTVEGNTASKNFDDGLLVLGDGNLIDRNLGRQNGFNGLAVDAIGNTVSRNTFDNNAEFGICVIAGNTDGGGNRAKGNGAGQIDFDCLVP